MVRGVFAHLWCYWTSCWTPVGKIAKLNVRIKNPHARICTKQRLLRKRELTVLFELVLTQVVIEIIETRGGLVSYHKFSRLSRWTFQSGLSNNRISSYTLLRPRRPVSLGLLIHFLEYRRLQVLPTLVGLRLGLFKFELFAEVNFVIDCI